MPQLVDQSYQPVQLLSPDRLVDRMSEGDVPVPGATDPASHLLLVFEAQIRKHRARHDRTFRNKVPDRFEGFGPGLFFTELRFFGRFFGAGI